MGALGLQRPRRRTAALTRARCATPPRRDEIANPKRIPNAPTTRCISDAARLHVPSRPKTPCWTEHVLVGIVAVPNRPLSERRRARSSARG